MTGGSGGALQFRHHAHMTTVPKYPFDLDRAAIYRELARVVAEDQPFTMMWNYSEIRAFSKRLRGVEFAPSGVFLFQPTPPPGSDWWTSPGWWTHREDAASAEG